MKRKEIIQSLFTVFVAVIAMIVLAKYYKPNDTTTGHAIDHETKETIIKAYKIGYQQGIIHIVQQQGYNPEVFKTDSILFFLSITLILLRYLSFKSIILPTL